MRYVFENHGLAQDNFFMRPIRITGRRDDYEEREQRTSIKVFLIVLGVVLILGWLKQMTSNPPPTDEEQPLPWIGR